MTTLMHMMNHTKNDFGQFQLLEGSLALHAIPVEKPGEVVADTSTQNTLNSVLFILTTHNSQIGYLKTRNSAKLMGQRDSYAFSCSTLIYFLPARRYASAGLCDKDVSVCLPVTRRYCA